MVGIGFFAPLPLAMMMPFMAGQSMIMGDAFGKAYQYGKRKISSMTNEQFNALTPEKLATELQTDYLSMIPSLKASVKASTEFQSFIIQELATIVKNLPPDLIKGIAGASSVGDALTGQGELGIAPDISQANVNLATQDIHNTLEHNLPDLIKSISNFFNSFAIIPQAFADKVGTTITPTIQGPSTFNIPTNTFQNIQDTTVDLQKQAEETKAQEEYQKLILANQTPLTVGEQAQKEYLTSTINAQQVILTTKQTWTTFRSRYDLTKTNLTWQQGADLLKQVSIAEAKYTAAKKILINIITHARNVGHTQSVASRDWNDRIWLI